MSAGRILVADDNLWIRRLLLTILKRHGYDCVEAVDGLIAIDHLRAGEWDGVILDLMMPRADGFEVIRFLRKDRPELLPITVVLTADSSRWSHEDLDVVGRVIQKPFDMHELVPMLAKVFRPAQNRAE